MNTRIAQVMAQVDLGPAGTHIIDINLKDIVSRLVVKFRAINGSDGLSAHPAANITKIELVDGSDVLFSLSGFQAQALNYYDRERLPWSYVYSADTKGNTAMFGIDFGRYLYDPLLGFDPGKFINPQLKITYDEDVSNTDCTENYCEVIAHIFDDLPVDPPGFFMTKEVYSYIVGTSGYEYLDLPVDFITHQIYFKGLLAYYDLTGEVAAFRLSEDNDRKIPLDITSYLLQEQVFEQYGFCEEHAKIYAGAGVINIPGMPSGEAHALGSAEGAAELLSVWSQGGGLFGTSNTGGTMRGRLKMIGVLAHGMIPLLPKPGPAIADWYDVTKLGSLKLRINDGATAADTVTGEVVVKQYRPYGE